jgi:ferredoxin
VALEIEIDRDTCMGSGNCTFAVPGVFALDDEGTAVVLDPSAGDEAKIMEAAKNCPSKAITVRLS